MGRCVFGESVRGEWDEKVEIVGLLRVSFEVVLVFRKVIYFISWGVGGGDGVGRLRFVFLGVRRILLL